MINRQLSKLCLCYSFGRKLPSTIRLNENKRLLAGCGLIDDRCNFFLDNFASFSSSSKRKAPQPPPLKFKYVPNQKKTAAPSTPSTPTSSSPIPSCSNPSDSDGDVALSNTNNLSTFPSETSPSSNPGSSGIDSPSRFPDSPELPEEKKKRKEVKTADEDGGTPTPKGIESQPVNKHPNDEGPPEEHETPVASPKIDDSSSKPPTKHPEEKSGGSGDKDVKNKEPEADQPEQCLPDVPIDADELEEIKAFMKILKGSGSPRAGYSPLQWAYQGLILNNIAKSFGQYLAPSMFTDFGKNSTVGSSNALRYICKSLSTLDTNALAIASESHMFKMFEDFVKMLKKKNLSLVFEIVDDVYVELISLKFILGVCDREPHSSDELEVLETIGQRFVYNASLMNESASSGTARRRFYAEQLQRGATATFESTAILKQKLYILKPNKELLCGSLSPERAIHNLKFESYLTPIAPPPETVQSSSTFIDPAKDFRSGGVQRHSERCAASDWIVTDFNHCLKGNDPISHIRKHI